MLSTGVATKQVNPNHIAMFPVVALQAQMATAMVATKKNRRAASLGVDHPR